MIFKNRAFFVIFGALRGVAQPGRASALGAECRQFESGYPDTKKDPLRALFSFLFNFFRLKLIFIYIPS